MIRKLAVIDETVADRCARTTQDRPDWPCHAGCDDCCRSLAEVPEMTEPEWDRLRGAIGKLGEAAREKICAMWSVRPITCPLLDEAAGVCLVYEARPIACRTYGFYADRGGVLGCRRILEVAERDDAVVWGNHESVMDAQRELGERRSLLAWLDASGVASQK
jgi:Fe-S-cluster containining protein